MAVEYLQYYDNKSPEEALNMFRSRIQRAWGHAAIFAWADLILDRSRTVVGLQSPAATAAAAAGDPNLDNLFHAMQPDYGQGVRARTWRAHECRSVAFCWFVTNCPQKKKTQQKGIIQEYRSVYSPK